MAEQQHDPGKQQDRWVFLGTTGLLFVALVVGLARQQHWGERASEVQLMAPSAAGLRTGIDVRISGLPVGQVVGLELEPDAHVRVRMKIADRYRRLVGPNSVASQGVDGFVGDHFIAISPDPQPAGGQAAPRLLPYTQPVDLTQLLEQLVVTQVALQANLRQISTLTARHVPPLVGQLDHTLKTVDQLSATATHDLNGTLPQLRRTLQTVDRTGQTANQLMTNANPVLVPTLQQVQQLATTANRLLQLLGASGWLEPATPPASQRPRP